jgi:hypothetical protein
MASTAQDAITGDLNCSGEAVIVEAGSGQIDDNPFRFQGYWCAVEQRLPPLT